MRFLPLKVVVVNENVFTKLSRIQILKFQTYALDEN